MPNFILHNKHVQAVTWELTDLAQGKTFISMQICDFVIDLSKSHFDPADLLKNKLDTQF